MRLVGLRQLVRMAVCDGLRRLRSKILTINCGPFVGFALDFLVIGILGCNRLPTWPLKAVCMPS